jgi:hypothetical protein
MRGVNDRNFLNFWQILYRATCPSPAQTHWHVGDVDWRKDRHSFSGTDYAVTLEVHLLRRTARDGGAWALMVATEHWWHASAEPLRSTSWARVLEGNPRVITSWLQRQDKVRSAISGHVNAGTTLTAS